MGWPWRMPGWAGCCLVILLAGRVHGQDGPGEPLDLRQIVARQQKQIEELNHRLNAYPLPNAPDLLPVPAAEDGPIVQTGGQEESEEQDLHPVVAHQQEQIEELTRRINALSENPAALAQVTPKSSSPRSGQDQPSVSAPKLMPNPWRQPKGQTDQVEAPRAAESKTESKPLSKISSGQSRGWFAGGRADRLRRRQWLLHSQCA